MEEIKIDGFTAIVPNEIYSRERKSEKKSWKADAGSWQSETEEKSSTDILFLSIASVPSRKETLERIAEEAQGIVADVNAGKLNLADMLEYKDFKPVVDSDYTLAQQVLLCMPYAFVEKLATAIFLPRTAKDYIEIAMNSYPLPGKNGMPLENDNDLDVIKIIYMPWDTKALNGIKGDKASADFYWSLLGPGRNLIPITLLMEDGKLDGKDNIAAKIKSAKMQEYVSSALLSAVNAVYACNTDDIADRSAIEWHSVAYATVRNMHTHLGILEKMRALKEKRMQTEKPDAMPALKAMAAAQKKAAE